MPGSLPDADKQALLASGLCFDFHKVRLLTCGQLQLGSSSRTCWLSGTWLHKLQA